MRSHARQLHFAKLGIVFVFSFLAVICFLMSGRPRVDASASGPSPSYTFAPGETNCTACHSDFQVNSGPGSVQISGLPQTYTTGQQIAVTVTTSQVGQTVYGFQLTAIDSTGKTVGSFSLPNGQMQTVTNVVSGQSRTYVEHTISGITPTQFNTKSWTFTWTAPNTTAGQVNFFAAGNAANSDGSTSGDYIYTTTKSINAAASGPVSVGGRVFTSDGIHGLRNTAVTLTDANHVVLQTVTTSSFGFYSFDNVQAGATYTIAVKSRLFRFQPQTVSPNANLSNVDFIGLE